MKKKVEIMAPVGSYESLMAAIKAGADSVYFGILSLNMRSNSANNFTLSDLKKISKICKKNKVKAYLALNSIMYDSDIKLMEKIIDNAKKYGVDAIIASDIAAISYACRKKINVHLSTQANISNIESVKFYSKYANVIVLARELTLEQIKNISYEIKKQKIKGPNKKPVGIEIFAHGALCISISGRCFMSLSVYNSSANRGKCIQNCRRSYRVIDDETGSELLLDNKFVMSPKDLCTIGLIDRIIDSGASVLKIEGRGRSPDYTYTVTKAYKEAVSSYYNGSYTKQKINRWIKELKTVYNRGFWHGGYYLGKKINELSGAYGSKATKEKVLVGKVKNYFTKPKIAEFILNSGKIKNGDEILITGPTTGVVKCSVKSIFVDGKEADSAGKGDSITIPINEKVRENDKLFIIKDKKR